MSRNPNNPHSISFQEAQQPVPRRGQSSSQQQQQPSRGGQAPPVPRKESIPKGTNVYEQAVPTLGYEEAYGQGGFSGADVRRKKSMVRPDRERIEPGHRHFHYREHAADDNVRVQPSSESPRPRQCAHTHGTAETDTVPQ